MLFKVLVLAMLSTASGWGLPSNDSLLSSNESTNITDGVDGARDLRQLKPKLNGEKFHGCSCDWGCDASCDGWLGTKCDAGCDSGCNDGDCDGKDSEGGGRGGRVSG